VPPAAITRPVPHWQGALDGGRVLPEDGVPQPARGNVSLCSIEKARTLLGWEPRHTWRIPTPSDGHRTPSSRLRVTPPAEAVLKLRPRSAADPTASQVGRDREGPRQDASPGDAALAPAGGRSAFPKSTKPHRIAENFDVFDFEITDAESAATTPSTGVRGAPSPTRSPSKPSAGRSPRPDGPRPGPSGPNGVTQSWGRALTAEEFRRLLDERRDVLDILKDAERIQASVSTPGNVSRHFVVSSSQRLPAQAVPTRVVDPPGPARPATWGDRDGRPAAVGLIPVESGSRPGRTGNPARHRSRSRLSWWPR
jgi:hypothetical protein